MLGSILIYRNWSIDHYISKRNYASALKRVFVQNLSYENKFDLRENEVVCETHFHMNGFALRLVLIQR